MKEKIPDIELFIGVDNPTVDSLTYTGNHEEIDPESTNYSSVCPDCGQTNDRADVIKIPRKLTAWYQCGKCGTKYVENFGISLG